MYSLYINSDVLTVDGTGLPHGATTLSLHLTNSGLKGHCLPQSFCRMLSFRRLIHILHHDSYKCIKIYVCTTKIIWLNRTLSCHKSTLYIWDSSILIGTEAETGGSIPPPPLQSEKLYIRLKFIIYFYFVWCINLL
jgi:hypothetical protein